MDRTERLIAAAWPIFQGGYIARVRRLFGSSLLAYWPLGESGGTTALDRSGNGRNGTYTGVDLANTPAPGGGGAPFFDGVSDLVNVYSAGLASLFNGVAGTAATWVKVGAGVWTDSLERRSLTLTVDGNNFVVLAKTAGANTLRFAYRAGGTTQLIDQSGQSSTAWLHTAMTWDANAGASGEVKAYINGAQVSGTQTSLGSWAGVLAPSTANLGCESAAIKPWNGWLAHALILNRAATAAELLKLCRWGA